MTSGWDPELFSKKRESDFFESVSPETADLIVGAGAKAQVVELAEPGIYDSEGEAVLGEL
jgi:hypothetical protein